MNGGWHLYIYPIKEGFSISSVGLAGFVIHHQLLMTDGGLEGETKKIDPRHIQKPSLISPEVQSLGPLLQWA